MNTCFCSVMASSPSIPAHERQAVARGLQYLLIDGGLDVITSSCFQTGGHLSNNTGFKEG